MSAAHTSATLPEAYARWQDRLSAEFFAGRRDQPVVMFVDREELSNLADPGEDGARSLASAVRELVDVDRGRLMFARAQRMAKAWQEGTRAQPPPTLPILALSVLAASEMRRDREGARHNYYIRLTRALLFDGGDAEIAALRYDLRERGAFVAVTSMWEQLDGWLSEQAGAFGISTIHGDSEQTRIGYPLSQALVRRSDRAALTQFFARLNLGSEGVPGPESLLNMLRIWVEQHAHGFTDRFVQALHEKDVLGCLTPLLHDLAKAWDGRIITPEGLRHLDLRLALDLDQGTAWWVIPSVPDLPEDILSGRLGGEAFEALITIDPHSSMYDAQGLPRVNSVALVSGLAARGAKSVAKYQPSENVVLADNADAGGWMSVDAVQPFEEHVFVVAADKASAVEQALSAAADHGWRRLPSRVTGRLFGGNFEIFDEIVFSDRESLDAAVDALPGDVAANLHLGTAARPRLVNGLPLLRGVTRNRYLQGGEPDLALPVGAEPRDVIVTLDGTAGQLRASIFPFPFRRFGPYDRGPHTVEADGEKLSFVVSPGSADDRTPPGLGALAWTDGALQDSARDGGDVCGAITQPERIERPVLARRGLPESWLIKMTGQITRLAEPPPPSFLPQVLFPQFEVERDRAPWLAQKHLGGWTITRMHVREPAFCGLSAEDRLLWSDLVTSVVTDDPIWKLYCRAWERFCGR